LTFKAVDGIGIISRVDYIQKRCKS